MFLMIFFLKSVSHFQINLVLKKKKFSKSSQENFLVTLYLTVSLFKMLHVLTVVIL